MGVNGPACLLRLQDVGKTYVDYQYRQVVALEEITFCLQPGEFLSIVGPSGCGKSTLLRIVAGLVPHTSGTIEFDGRPIQGPGRERGLVFQSYSAFPWLTVRENVGFGLMDSPSTTDKVDSWLTDMGLKDFADAYPKTLSGGMCQRLAIARAMIVEPKLLLLDEPFGALDDHTRGSMQDLLLKVATQNHCTLVLVTHDIREALLLSSRVVVLSARPGRVKEIVESNLPIPRTRHQLRTPEFECLYQHIADRCEPDPPAISNIQNDRRGRGLK